MIREKVRCNHWIQVFCLHAMFCYVFFILFYNENIMLLSYLFHNYNDYTQKQILKVKRERRRKWIPWIRVNRARKRS